MDFFLLIRFFYSICPLLRIIDVYVVHSHSTSLVILHLCANCYAENGDACGNLYSQEASAISLEMCSLTVATWCHDHSSRVLKQLQNPAPQANLPPYFICQADNVLLHSAQPDFITYPFGLWTVVPGIKAPPTGLKLSGGCIQFLKGDFILSQSKRSLSKNSAGRFL